METFGTRLKKLRNERGITQEKLARDLDIPESSIRRLEISDGVPRMERLDQIAEYFNKSTDYLLGRETKNELHNEETEDERKLKEIERLIKKITLQKGAEATIEFLNYVDEEVEKGKI